MIFVHPSPLILLLVGVLMPGLGRADDRVSRDTLAARYANAHAGGADVPTGGAAWDGLDAGGREAVLRAVADSAARDQRADDLMSRDALTRSGPASHPTAALISAGAHFASFVNVTDQAERERFERDFRAVAKHALPLLDYGVTTEFGPRKPPANLDRELNNLAAAFVTELLEAGFENRRNRPADSELHLTRAFRFLTEAYGLAANNLGNYVQIRTSYLNRLAARGVVAGSIAMLVVAAALKWDAPAYVPVTASLAMLGSIFTPFVLIMRESVFERYDRATPTLAAARATYAFVVIERFWTYVGREITSRGPNPWSTPGEDTLAAQLRAGPSLYEHGEVVARPAAVVDAVRRRMTTLEGTSSLMDLCARVLTKNQPVNSNDHQSNLSPEESRAY